MKKDKRLRKEYKSLKKKELVDIVINQEVIIRGLLRGVETASKDVDDEIIGYLYSDKTTIG